MTDATLAAPSVRFTCVDAFRGLVMLLMLAEVLHLPKLATTLLEDKTRVFQAWEADAWREVKFNTDHVAWAGASLHDLIQPGFSFLVGAAMVFSVAGRKARGHSPLRMTLHAAWRAALLIWLGIFLRSIDQKQTNWIFTDTLSQIGLGYLFLFGLSFLRPGWAWAAVIVILVGYFAAWALHPLPPTDFDYKSVGVPVDWPHHFSGFMAHWNKNSNPGTAFDQWFLNLFPRKEEFVFNKGGYSTLNFIPTLATMMLGLIAGQWLRGTVSAAPPKAAARAAQPKAAPSAARDGWSLRAEAGSAENTAADPTAVASSLSPAAPPSHPYRIHSQPAASPASSGGFIPALGRSRALLLLLIAGSICLSLGWTLHEAGICPIVKRIWTPAWTLYSAGWCFLILAAFYLLADLRPNKVARVLLFPLLVIGANSIVAYVMDHTIQNFVAGAFTTHFGADVFNLCGDMFAPQVRGAMVLMVYWLILLWMYRQRFFVRV